MTSYVGVFIIKEQSLAWIARVKQLAALAAQVNNSLKTSYIGVFLIKEHSLAWIAHVQQLAALAAQVNKSPQDQLHRGLYYKGALPF
jgi:hypothetical protein